MSKVAENVDSSLYWTLFVVVGNPIDDGIERTESFDVRTNRGHQFRAKL